MSAALRRVLAAGTTAVVGLAVVAPAAHAAAPSSTVLAVNGTTVGEAYGAHGQDLPLTAQVAVEGAQPAGWVFFEVDGLARRAAVGPDGVATADLTDDLPAGTHQVSATFVPADPAQQDGSTTPVTTLRVGKVSTKPRVRAHGLRAGQGIRVRTRVRAPYGTTPTRVVQVTLRRAGERWRWTRRATLDAGAAVLTFEPRRPFAAGRYHVVVRYQGDGNHQGSRKGRALRIRRG